MHIRRKKSKQKLLKVLNEIKQNSGDIVFRTKNTIITLRNKRQLLKWLEKYPTGTYEIKGSI